MVHNPQRQPGRLAAAGAVVCADRHRVGWHVLWFVSDPLVNQLALRIAVCSGSALIEFSESTTSAAAHECQLENKNR
ncbi:MAG: hypothetical protein KDA72_13625 [Planctomycetales bacterium]|nr:hypothetical protein [Planctomycetales bacterium]